MRALRDWSFASVLLVSGSWMLVCILATATWLLFQFRDVFRASSGSGGISAVSFGFNAVLLAIPVLPPVILIVACVIARWFHNPRALSNVRLHPTAATRSSC